HVYLFASLVIACSCSHADLVADIAMSVIKCGPAPPFASLPAMAYFLSSLATATPLPCTSLPPVIFLASAVYLTRLKTRLPQNATGKWCTVHRIAMAALVVACKYFFRGFNVPMSNRHWARKTHYFKVQEINLMERELLAYLVCVFTSIDSG
ncbi:hypothetical protein BJ742DRAFT_670578, partial [Cladochytrium replicatum]